MNAILRPAGIDMWQLAGWTMLHYLWLGLIAGLAAGALRLVLRRASANVRYVAALGCLTVLAVLPLVIAVQMCAQLQIMPTMANSVDAPYVEIATPAPGSAGGLTGSPHPTGPMDTGAAIEPEPLVAANAGSNPRQSRGLADLTANIAEYLPWLWIIGTPLTFLLLATGVIGSERLRRSSCIIHDGPIADARARLVESLHVGRSVTVAICERIAAPMLVGILRPIILLPPAALTGWSPDEIEMVLLHELAHVRRWDNLVNLVQRLVEAVLFFHPAVWLVSSWVRREREACCDSVVVGRTNRPHEYAELLVNLAAHVSEPSEPGRPRPRVKLSERGRGRPGSLVSSAMAAGPLRHRIRHILQLEDDPMLISGKSLGVVMSGLLLVATLIVLNLPSRTQAEDSTSENTEKADLSDRDEGEDSAATQNNLKNLLLALLNYNDSEHSFPAVANFDANGRALLSWRVQLLPYLGEEALYKEFHLDEPWDSEHNRKLIAEMPKVFKNPRIDRPGVTNYLAVVGSECMFDGTPNGIRLEQVTDGTANTIALVEADADQAVEWTKPQDWEFDRAHPTAGLGGLWSDHWFAFRVDGSSCRIGNHNRSDEAGILFTRAGGERKDLSESAVEKKPLVAENKQSAQSSNATKEEELFGSPSDSTPTQNKAPSFRSKFIPSDTNRLESKHYEIANAPEMNLRLDHMVDMLKRDPSEPKPFFAYNWTNDWTRLEIIAPRQGQDFIEPIIRTVQSTPNIDGINSGDANAQATSTFVDIPFVVGASRFEAGDSITITEVRGTANTMEPGNNYLIRGTYALASRNSARLMASVTAKNRVDGTGAAHSNQSAELRGGSGTFALELRMSAPGWPHVSFYPTDGGEGFGGIYFGTDDSVLENWSEVYGSDDTRSAENHAKVDRGKFPSLEDQKLADLAFRRLGIELGPLDEEQLKRVRALGYDGGLSVTIRSNHGPTWEEVHTGDLLVGLAVWPTTSLRDIAEILNRDDLAELSPLKFYVVRAGSVSEDGGKTYIAKDVVISGRISVKLDTEARPLATNTFVPSYSPIANSSGKEPGKARLRILYLFSSSYQPKPAIDPWVKLIEAQYPTIQVERVDVDSQRALAADLMRKYRLNQAPAFLVSRGYESVVRLEGNPSESQLQDALQATNKAIVGETVGSQSDASTTDALQPAKSNPATASSPTDKASLRYDGKTFDEWRTIWQTELSTEKRLEVVKALAAFGASGQGREATEAILGVVEQLQWQTIESESSAGKLKKACIDAFTSGESTGGYRIPAADWLPIVAEKLKVGSAPLKLFVMRVFSAIQFGDTSVVPHLVALSRDKETKELAFIGLKAVDRALERKEVLECFRESIQESAEDPEFLARTINYLRFQPYRQNGEPPFTSLRFVPEIEAALFHPDEKVRRAARIALTGIQPSDARGLVERLSKLLDDESRKDRTEVIRALAAIGPQALPVEEKLTKMAHSNSDPNRYAAAVALEQIRSNRDESYQNLEIDPGATDFSPYQRRLDAERKELFPNGIYPPRDPILGGGGGFF